jgi:hypothetical protein
VGPEEPRVQTNAGNPLADQSGVLSRRYRSIPPATAEEEKLTQFLFCRSDVVVDCFSGMLRDLKFDRLAVFL